jgi:transcriptional regulator of acetoin/glycerol metabolism
MSEMTNNLNKDLDQLNEQISKLEKASLILALKTAGGNLIKAAGDCGLSEVDFILKLKAHDLLRVH